MVGSPNPIQLKVGIPLIEAASLEEDEVLQEMFANLLVNATDSNRKIDINRSFVTILQDFGSLEAALLLSISKKSGDGMLPVRTARLPAAYVEEDDKISHKPPVEVEIALWNLHRLGCIEPGTTWDGGSIASVKITPLGIALLQACST